MSETSNEDDGVARIARERRRQVEELGFTPKHDDEEHHGGDLALVAACYAASAAHENLYLRRDYAAGQSYDDPFPWSKGGRGSPCYDERPYDGNVLKNPTDEEAIELLAKVGALAAAEIDRLLRKKHRADARSKARGARARENDGTTTAEGEG